jgi:hypothetical protein
MLHRAVSIALLLAVVLAPGREAAAVPGPAAAAPPATPGLARVWFLRQFQPAESLRMPMIYVNGVPLASSVPGTVFYRDFPPGTYTFTVETCTVDVGQATTLNLAAGSQSALEVQSLSSFRSWGCLGDDTFYVRAIPPASAQLYLPQLSYIGAR